MDAESLQLGLRYAFCDERLDSTWPGLSGFDAGLVLCRNCERICKVVRQKFADRINEIYSGSS